MTQIHAGRFTAVPADEFVVFLIGMRFNRPLRIRSWLPVLKAMPAMQRELALRPELGCLGVHNWFGRTSLSLQYWRDFACLEAYSRAPEHLHLPAWREFNRGIRNNGDVGIWHETYRVSRSGSEAIYGNMPVSGLAAAFEHHPVGRVGQSAGRRIGARQADETVVEPY
ncbi:MAG: DUF4188 domain-containing protein [Pseudomonadales bacterium]|nr:DUF4188 domain-containing protein [Pseudomonadales bacterium]